MHKINNTNSLLFNSYEDKMLNLNNSREFRYMPIKASTTPDAFKVIRFEIFIEAFHKPIIMLSIHYKAMVLFEHHPLATE